MIEPNPIIEAVTNYEASNKILLRGLNTPLVISHQKSKWFIRHFSSQTKKKVILMLISVGTSIDNLVQSQTELVSNQH